MAHTGRMNCLELPGFSSYRVGPYGLNPHTTIHTTDLAKVNEGSTSEFPCRPLLPGLSSSNAHTGSPLPPTLFGELRSSTIIPWWHATEPDFCSCHSESLCEAKKRLIPVLTGSTRATRAVAKYGSGRMQMVCFRLRRASRPMWGMRQL